MFTKDLQKRFSAMREEIELIYKTAYELPKSEKRDTILLMLALLYGSVRQVLETTEEM